MIDEKLLTTEERAAYTLRSLYTGYGYLPFRMSKFEKYDFYARNKDFLVSDRMITFTDNRGKLLALKPDVTLSIIKSGTDTPGVKQKLCYSEKVYRAVGSMGQFREIMQAGLECIGDLDTYDLYEVVSLAVRSLELFGSAYVLNLSHLGLLNALLDGLGGSGTLAQEAVRCIAGRNAHELEELCLSAGCSPQTIRELCFFASLHGPLREAVRTLAPFCVSDRAAAALSELGTLCAMLEDEGLDEHVVFDFSVVNNRKYYNGLVFQGFLAGVPESVLSGGQYDRLMARMGRSSSGLGFAMYLDRLVPETEDDAVDVDVLLLYDDPRTAAKTVRRLQADGKTVSAQRETPGKLRYRECLDLRGGAADA